MKQYTDVDIGRFEYKHEINWIDKLELQQRLGQFLTIDPHARDDKCYRVRSLYLDSLNDKALQEKLDGLNEREKYRFRLYNNDTSYIRLEKKSKRGGMTYKESCEVSQALVSQMIEGKLDGIQCEDRLVQELVLKMKTTLLRPKCIVDYTREAYIYEAWNVRVTIDSELKSSLFIDQFLTGHELYCLPNELDDVILLEVKYDQFLPELIRDVVKLKHRKSQAYSKYASSRLSRV